MNRLVGPGRISRGWIGRIHGPRLRPANAYNQQRTLFGLGDFLGVIANPGETLRSLADARKALQEAREDIQESKERAQIRPIHTFSPLPGFFLRPAEIRAITASLDGPPAFTVLFGASSVGKTALLREVLSKKDRYHVLFFDLRIAGFADLRSLYFSLATQMETYFDSLKSQPGWEEWNKEAWAFKHDRLAVERRTAEVGMNVEVSDVARIMELFQSALLKYWEFTPKEEDEGTENGNEDTEQDAPAERVKTRGKRTPVFFIDEAHKLPALIQSTNAMKVILDSMLVLTKQDHLCHVIHATSDPFYQTWLRQMNVMQHCQIMSIGDCSKSETSTYFYDRLMQDVPDSLQQQLSARFDELFDAFGGKLTHWADFVSSYVFAKGNLDIHQTSHYLQAYALLNLHLIHSSQDAARSNSNFKIYTPLEHSPHAAPSPYSSTPAGDGSDEEEMHPSFTSEQLLDVMSRLVTRQSISYFSLCREMGADAIDAMVRGRILELRWTPTITKEANPSKEEESLPALLPTTPIIAYAMRRVLHAWDDKH